MYYLDENIFKKWKKMLKAEQSEWYKKGEAAMQIPRSEKEKEEEMLQMPEQILPSSSWRTW